MLNHPLMIMVIYILTCAFIANVALIHLRDKFKPHWVVFYVTLFLLVTSVLCYHLDNLQRQGII